MRNIKKVVWLIAMVQVAACGAPDSRRSSKRGPANDAIIADKEPIATEWGACEVLIQSPEQGLQQPGDVAIVVLAAHKELEIDFARASIGLCDSNEREQLGDVSAEGFDGYEVGWTWHAKFAKWGTYCLQVGAIARLPEDAPDDAVAPACTADVAFDLTVDCPPGETCCQTTEDCDDDVACTLDSCIAGSCSHKYLDCTVCEDFTFVDTANAPTDIVIAVDTSGSMSAETTGVQDTINAFASFIADAGIDYHVTVVARRAAAGFGNAICVAPPLGGPACTDTERFMHVDTTIGSKDMLAKLKGYINTIEGFMRPNSIRHIVAVSDDESKVPGADFHAELTAREGWDGYFFHNVTGHGGACSPRQGLEYQWLSTQTGGADFDICKANWSALFEVLAGAVAAAGDIFKLAEPALENTVTVQIDGKMAIEGVQWAFDPSKQRFALIGDLPESGAAVRACYIPASP